MTESDGLPSAEDFRRLEESIKDLRKEIELAHNQQAYLQMQVSALRDAKSKSSAHDVQSDSFLRSFLIKIVKRNVLFYKVASRVNRFLRR
jgi:hypothetical protein